MSLLKSPPLVSKKLRSSAKGQDCTVNIANVCSYNKETTVLAHFNFRGGCIGSKTDDFSAGFCCGACHTHLDANKLHKEDWLFYTARSMVRTITIWLEKGLVSFK